ncbi:hypothetical protein [Paenibacillus sp. GCM10027626]|uniref:hypothetical protein n=1 Tax=Paenibacillus sp. GCM10027626 TaxID=3273411 RepID=UPI00362E66EC
MATDGLSDKEVKNKEAGEKPAIKAKETAKTPETTKTQQQLIYVGPNLPGGRLSRFRVFKEGIPSYLDDIVKSNPDISRLIVPIEVFTAVLARVSTPGTIEHAAAQKLIERQGEA